MACITTITTTVCEKGTVVVTISPTDSSGSSLTIGQLTDPRWQLMRPSGAIVNSRSFANCPLTSLSWVLTGDDLAIFGAKDTGNRVLSFQSTYESDVGSGLHLNAECYFTISKLLGQTDE